jgi:hypothetical protein
LHVPILDHPIYNQALGSGADYRRQRTNPGRLESNEDNHCLQKRRFAQRIPANDAGNLRVEIQIEPLEAAKVSYGKITEHLRKRTTNEHAWTRKQTETIEPQMNTDLRR